MTDSGKVFNIYPSESNSDQHDDNQQFGEVKRANTST